MDERVGAMVRGLPGLYATKESDGLPVHCAVSAAAVIAWIGADLPLQPETGTRQAMSRPTRDPTRYPGKRGPDGPAWQPGMPPVGIFTTDV
ncbi:MAG: hypothetical protein JNL87_06750 [Burkholderiaceae bacterium]|nr:hypothetical protein [Burkholderiaceae bacterium]